MTKLFIIGNGFDLAHKMRNTDKNLPTSYGDFRKWLVTNKKGNKDVKKSTLGEKLSEKYRFDNIIDRLLKKAYSMDLEQFNSVEKENEGLLSFSTGVIKEWTKLMNGEIKITGVGKEGVLTSLEKAQCVNLLKVFKEMSDEEWSQENMDKAIERIAN